MRILVVGATGTIGKEIVNALSDRHEVVGASRKSTPITVDIASVDSIRKMYAAVGQVDAVISAAGDARFKPLDQLTDEDFEYSLHNKLMGQVNLMRYGFGNVRDGGSFTLTSGVLSQRPMPGSGVISLVNGGLEGFTRAAALEAPRGIRVNIVSPPWVTETLRMYGMDPSLGLPAATVATWYVESVTGNQSGIVLSESSSS
jgi:NAD(P)-dependent dehydrogenase (short-subunit alcohol dehydrogenase family)